MLYGVCGIYDSVGCVVCVCFEVYCEGNYVSIDG